MTANGSTTYAGSIVVPGIGGLSELVAGTANAFVLTGGINLQTTGSLNVAGIGNVIVTGQVTDAVTSTLAAGLLEGSLTGAPDTTDPNPGVALNSASLTTYSPTSGVTTVGNMTALVTTAPAASAFTIAVNGITPADVVPGSVVTAGVAGIPAGATVVSVLANSITIRPCAPRAPRSGPVITYRTTFGGVQRVRGRETSAVSTTGVTDFATNALGPWYLGTATGTQTWVYTGQFNVPNTGGATTLVQFAEQVDDDTVLTIDGTTVINDTSFSNVTTSGGLALTPGWHNIEVRFANGGGGAGAVGNNSGWTVNFGFGVQGIAGAGQTAKPVTNSTKITSASWSGANPNVFSGTGDILAADYLNVQDSGAGEVFRHLVGGTLTMAGTGTLLLANATNSFHGPTTVNSGILAVSNSNALGSNGNITVGPRHARRPDEPHQ